MFLRRSTETGAKSPCITGLDPALGEILGHRTNSEATALLASANFPLTMRGWILRRQLHLGTGCG